MSEASTRSEPFALNDAQPVGLEESSLLVRRLGGLVQKMLSTHVDSLLALMVEQGVEPAEQRARMDILVRALGEARFEPQLFQGGRAIPISVDLDATPAQIRLNAALFEGIEDSALLRACHGPIAQILQLSPVAVGLVLQSEDERQLKMLVQQAARRAGGTRVWRTQIPALAEQYITLFEERLDALAEHYGYRGARDSSGRSEFLALLAAAEGSWPEWEEVYATKFMLRAIDALRDGMVDEEVTQNAPLLVELCWESLELSTRAFLHHAAQQLRAQSTCRDLSGALRAWADIFRKKGDAITEDAQDWPIFGELHQAWQALYRAEHRSLVQKAMEVQVPPISVFAPPGESLGLNEPASLPWEAPLLAWTVREHHALRDLLVGFKQALISDELSRSAAPASPGAEFSEEPLSVGGAPEAFEAKVMRQPRDYSDDYFQHLSRAVDACEARMLAQLMILDDAQRMRALQTLRAAYTGYFGGAKPVWQRRFQGWKSWEPGRALRVLSRELRHIMGPAMLFDPFSAPDEPTLSPMPNFVLVAPRVERDQPLFAHIPLGALRRGMHGSGVQIRVVDIEPGRCAWAGDVTLTSTQIEEHPTEVLLHAVENDSVRIRVDTVEEQHARA